MRQQARSGDPAFDWPAWRRRLHDRVAATACHLGAHMPDHPETGWHILKLLGHVFAQVPQPAAAGWAGLCFWPIDSLVAWQMVRQRLAHRLLAWGAVGLRHFPRCYTLVGLQVFQLQLELFDLVIELLGLAAELHAPQLGNPQLEMLDLGGARVQLRFQSRN